MRAFVSHTRQVLLAALGTLILIGQVASAGELQVGISGGFAPAYQSLSAEYERSSGNRLMTVRGPSMGETPQAIPNRLKRGEPIDVVIMVDSALDALIKDGKVAADSKVVLARSTIAMAVRAGAPKPDISSVEALKKALLDARSIVYSDSASGVYLSTVLFPRLGIADEIKGKARMIPAEPVGQVVARGEGELGFQQVSELLPVPGIDIVGPLPAAAQYVTLFSAGVVTGAHDPKAATGLIEFLASPASASAIRKTGLEPAIGNPN